MKRLFSIVGSHIYHHRGIYLFPLLTAALILAALVGLPLLTGRAVQDQPDAVIGFIYNLVGLNVVVIFVALAQPYLFGWNHPKQFNRSDALCTLALLYLAAHYLFR